METVHSLHWIKIPYLHRMYLHVIDLYSKRFFFPGDLLIYLGVIFVVFPGVCASKVSSSTRLILPGPGGEMAVEGQVWPSHVTQT